MVSDRYHLCRQAGENPYSITMPAIGSDGINIEAQMPCFAVFSLRTRFISSARKENGGVSPPP